MSLLVLVRHGESYGNRDASHWSDPSTNFLTLEGVEHAQMAGELLAVEGIRFDAVMSSKILRAQQTARYIIDTIAADHNQEQLVCHEWLNEREHYPEMEELQVVRYRVMHGIQEYVIPLLKEDLNVLLVSHYFTIREILAAICGVSTTGENRYRVLHGQPICIHFDHEFKTDYTTLGDQDKFYHHGKNT